MKEEKTRTVDGSALLIAPPIAGRLACRPANQPAPAVRRRPALTAICLGCIDPHGQLTKPTITLSTARAHQQGRAPASGCESVGSGATECMHFSVRGPSGEASQGEWRQGGVTACPAGGIVRQQQQVPGRCKRALSRGNGAVASSSQQARRARPGARGGKAAVGPCGAQERGASVHSPLGRSRGSELINPIGFNRGSPLPFSFSHTFI